MYQWGYDTGLVAASKILSAIGKIDGSMDWSDLDEYSHNTLLLRISRLENEVAILDRRQSNKHDVLMKKMEV